MSDRTAVIDECIDVLDSMFARPEEPGDVVSPANIVRNQVIQDCLMALVKIKSRRLPVELVTRLTDAEVKHYRAALSRLPESRPRNCPTCDSPAPNLHPAMQHEGEVQPCRDEWHFRDTPENGKQYRAIAEKCAAESRPTPGSELAKQLRECAAANMDGYEEGRSHWTDLLRQAADELDRAASVGAGTPPQEPTHFSDPNYVPWSLPPGCTYRPHISRICQRQTSGCEVDHAAAPVPPRGAEPQETACGVCDPAYPAPTNRHACTGCGRMYGGQPLPTHGATSPWTRQSVERIADLVEKHSDQDVLDDTTISMLRAYAKTLPADGQA